MIKYDYLGVMMAANGQNEPPVTDRAPEVPRDQVSVCPQGPS